MSERVTLDEVARAVHVRRFISRGFFSNQTGVRFTRYLTQLRLAARWNAWLRRERSHGLALELGFSSHSHLLMLSGGSLGRRRREIRKILEVRFWA
jgi:AraC-like DNA-binding protein